MEAHIAIEMARQHVAAQQYEQAEALVRQVLLAQPAHALARAVLADTHFHRGEWREAVFQAREALRTDPHLDSYYRVLVGRAEQQLGNVLANPEDEGLLWHVGREVSRYPDRRDDFRDLQELIARFVLPGWLPPHQPFTRESRLLTLGSCFATELRLRLSQVGVDAAGLWMPEGLNNTFALRHFIEWCVSGTPAADAYWYDADPAGGARKWTPNEEQAAYRDRFAAADGYVITVGLAEVWTDLETGGVFWRGVPRSMYEPGRYACRMTTVDENEANLRHVVAALRSLGPDKPIILTLSPVPLKATFRDESCVVMDCVSKSILRVALASVCGAHEPNVFYWPSFEIVKWLGCHIARPMFGENAQDERHLSEFVPALIVDQFVRCYFQPST